MIEILNSSKFNKDYLRGMILGEVGPGIKFVVKKQINEMLKKDNTQVFIMNVYGDYNEYCKAIDFEEDIVYTIDYENIEEDLINDFFITLCTLLKDENLTITEKSFLYKNITQHKPSSLQELNKILEKNQTNKEELKLALMTRELKESVLNNYNLQKESKLINTDFSAFNKAFKSIGYLLTILSIYNISKRNPNKNIILYITNPNVITYNKELTLFFYKIFQYLENSNVSITIVGPLDDIIKNVDMKIFLKNINQVYLLNQNPKNKEILQTLYQISDSDFTLLQAKRMGIFISDSNTDYFTISEK